MCAQLSTGAVSALRKVWYGTVGRQLCGDDPFYGAKIINTYVFIISEWGNQFWQNLEDEVPPESDARSVGPGPKLRPVMLVR